jgi:tRNA threonylcarbamoyladenosine biosynthesis protein TsaB
MKVTVGIETATAACSVAVEAGGELLAEVVARGAPAHTRRLLPDLQHVLEIAGAGPEDVESVVVGLGPGTFTGLRIGVATARALAFASGARLAGVPTLAALAWAMAEGEVTGRTIAEFVPLIDGKRHEVFAACYTRMPCDGDDTCGRLVEVKGISVVEADDLLEFVSKWPGAVVGGDGATLYRDSLPMRAFRATQVTAPTAAMVLRAWHRGVPGIVEGERCTPIYGRAPDAVRWIERAKKAT